MNLLINAIALFSVGNTRSTRGGGKRIVVKAVVKAVVEVASILLS